jgi:hypothetical protein
MRRYALWTITRHACIYPRICYPIGSALTPVPKFFVRVPRFFPAFFPPRCPSSWSPSPTVQVRFVRGTSPSPDVVEKRCGCNVSCGTVSIPCAVAVLRVRRVCEATVYLSGCNRQGSEEKRRTRCVVRVLFRALTFASRASPFPPPPAVSSTLIRRPSSSDWCMRSAACSADRIENSRNAQPFDLVTVAPGRVSLGASKRTVGGGSIVSEQTRVVVCEEGCV